MGCVAHMKEYAPFHETRDSSRKRPNVEVESRLEVVPALLLFHRGVSATTAAKCRNEALAGLTEHVWAAVVGALPVD